MHETLTPDNENPIVAQELGASALADVQYRTEHSRNIEDAEKYQAIEKLKELGILTPVADLDVYHGRVAHVDEANSWSVDPSFSNGSNDSGNFNVNVRPTLYTSTPETAREFAMARGRDIVRPQAMEALSAQIRTEDPVAYRKAELAKDQERYNLYTAEQRKYYKVPDEEISMSEWTDREVRNVAHDRFADREARKIIWQEVASQYTAKVHEIASSDADATIVNTDFAFSKLTADQTQEYFTAMSALMPKVSAGAPASFNERAAMASTYKELLEGFNAKYEKEGLSARVTREEIDNMVADTGASSELVSRMAGVINARSYLLGGITRAANMYVQSNAEFVKDNKAEGDAPLSLEFIGSFMRNAHIVGMSSEISSATLNKDINVISFFDLHKVDASERYDAKRSELADSMQPIAHALEGAFEVSTDTPKILKLLENPYAKPQAIIAEAREVGEFAKEFDADAGNWEGYTLGEHTETVLRNFDENYADKLPVGLLAPIRLALVAHDIGKPASFRANKRYLQKGYNAKIAGEFFDEISLDDKAQDFLQALIGDGMALTHNVLVRNDAGSLEQLRAQGRGALGKLTGAEVTDAMVDGYLEICEALFVCDGGAYTTMAVTRNPKLGYYRNAGSFDASFKPATDPGKRSLALRNPGLKQRS